MPRATADFIFLVNFTHNLHTSLRTKDLPHCTHNTLFCLNLLTIYKPKYMNYMNMCAEMRKRLCDTAQRKTRI